MPIALALGLMAGARWTARTALAVAWLSTAALVMLLYRMPAFDIAVFSAFGAAKASEFLLVIIGALTLMNVLRMAGALETITAGFRAVSPDPRVQAVVVGWLFGALIEGVAGFGTPAAIAAPLLVRLGFPALPAAAVCLAYNCTPVSFAAGGLPVEAAAGMVTSGFAVPDEAAFTAALTLRVALLHAGAGLLLPPAGLLLLARLTHGHTRAAWCALPFALFAGAAMIVPYLLSAWLLGPEFPAIAGSLVGLAIVVPAARAGILRPRTPWTWPAGHPEPTPPAALRVGVLAAWAPFALVVVVLLATRMPGLGVRTWLASAAFETEAFLGRAGLAWHFAPLENLGLVPFGLAALLALPLFRLRPRDGFAALGQTLYQLRVALPAMLFAVAMVQLMIHGGDGQAAPSLLEALGQAAAHTGVLYPLIAPYIGLLGPVVSRSNTMSNILFAAPQYQTAQVLGLAPAWIVAGQTAGGATGSMLNFNTTLAVCASLGCPGQEGRLIRANAPVCLGYGAVLAVLATLGVWLAG